MKKNQPLKIGAYITAFKAWCDKKKLTLDERVTAYGAFEAAWNFFEERGKCSKK
jgi:hypothetical protein